MWPWRQKKPNRWRSLVLGVAGSLVGLLLMRIYRQAIAPLVKQSLEQQNLAVTPESHALDSIAVVGRHHEKGESATAALGRILYNWAADDDPGQETKSTLSYLVHWGYGMAQGAAYGFLRPRATWPDLSGGIFFGATLWALGDELMVPLLGLQKGPTAASTPQHVNRLGMHLAYGIGTAAATQALNALFEE